MKDSFDMVIVGAGLAGLMAAATAGRGGASTLLLDPHPVGGRARSQLRDGFILNNGPHALYRGGQTLTALAELGVHPTGGQPVYSGAGALFNGGIEPFPFGAGALLRTKMLSPKSRLRASMFFSRIGHLDPTPWIGRPFSAWLSTLPADLAGLVDMLVRTGTYVDAADTLDAAAAMMQMQRARDGVVYLDGGWQRMVDDLLAVVVAAGVDVRTATAVDRVEAVEDGVAIAAGGSVIRAKSVVVAVGSPTETKRIIDRPIAGTDRIGYPVEASVLDLGVRRVPRVPLLFGNGVPLYLSTHAPAAQLAPDGLALVTVMRYLRPGTAPRDPRTARQELLQLASAAGVSDDDIVLRRYLHRVPVMHGYPTAEGGGFAGRPTVTSSGIDNILIAGDWVGATGMLADASVASGIAAATAALHSQRMIDA